MKETLRAAWTRWQQDPRWFRQGRTTNRFILSYERGALLFACAVFSTGILATLASALGVFRIVAPLALLGWLAAAIGIVILVVKDRFEVAGDRADLIALGIALLLAVSAGVFHHHYFASHADIGFYAADAAATATTGSRVIHGPYDEVLPGFAAAGDGYHQQGMFGYSSLGALFAFAGGIFFTPWVNAPLAFISASMVYFTGRHLGARSGAVFGQLFFATSLLTVWLSRWIMTENAASATFWTSVVLAFGLLRKWDPIRFSAMTLALVYGSLVRPEGLVFLGWFVLVIIARFARPLLDASRNLRQRRFALRRGPAIATASAVLFAVAAVATILRAVAGQYLRHSFDLATRFFNGRATADSYDVPTTGPGPNWGDIALRYEWDSALAYLVPYFLLVGVLGIALRIIPWRRALFLAILCLPFIVFILMPPVTTAHPWFMRRLWVAIVPLSYILAGAALDVNRVGYRWPFRRGMREEPRLRNIAAALLIALVLLGVNVEMTAPLALESEQDSVDVGIGRILPHLPPDGIVLIDEGALEHASPLRFTYDGDVIAWFNERALSFRLSTIALDQASNATILRGPSAGRNVLGAVQEGEGEPVSIALPLANPPRKDFRTYIANPPLSQGYRPLQDYLEEDVPPDEMLRGEKTIEVVPLVKPFAIRKNAGFAPGEWAKTATEVVAFSEEASIEIHSDTFRDDVIQSVQLAIHIAYVQHGTEPFPVTANGDVLGHLPSDGSQTLAHASILLPVPLSITSVEVPRGLVVRGILVDLP